LPFADPLSALLSRHGSYPTFGFKSRLTGHNDIAGISFSVTLNLFQGLWRDQAPVTTARWMLKQVQHDKVGMTAPHDIPAVRQDPRFHQSSSAEPLW